MTSGVVFFFFLSPSPPFSLPLSELQGIFLLGLRLGRDPYTVIEITGGQKLRSDLCHTVCRSSDFVRPPRLDYDAPRM